MLVRARQPGVAYDVDVRGDTIFIRANDDHINFRLATASLANPGDWRTLIAGSDRDYITGFVPFTSYLAIAGRRDGLDLVRLRRDDGSETTVPAAFSPTITTLPATIFDETLPVIKSAAEMMARSGRRP